MLEGHISNHLRKFQPTCNGVEVPSSMPTFIYVAEHTGDDWVFKPGGRKAIEAVNGLFEAVFGR